MHIPNSLKPFGIEQAVDYITKDPEKNLPTLMTWVDKFSRGGFPSQRAAIRDAITNPDNPDLVSEKYTVKIRPGFEAKLLIKDDNVTEASEEDE